MDAREIDVAAGTELAAYFGAAPNASGFDFFYDEPKEAGIDDYGSSWFEVLVEPGVIDFDGEYSFYGGGGNFLIVEDDAVFSGDMDGLFTDAGANFGTLDVHHEGDVAVYLGAGFADKGCGFAHPIWGGVSHIDAADVCSAADELTEFFRGEGGGSECEYGFGVAVGFSHGGKGRFCLEDEAFPKPGQQVL